MSYYSGVRKEAGGRWIPYEVLFVPVPADGARTSLLFFFTALLYCQVGQSQGRHTLASRGFDGF